MFERELTQKQAAIKLIEKRYKNWYKNKKITDVKWALLSKKSSYIYKGFRQSI